MTPCAVRSWDSRIEVKTVPVHHVCYEPERHPGNHRCSCGYQWERDP